MPLSLTTMKSKKLTKMNSKSNVRMRTIQLRNSYSINSFITVSVLFMLFLAVFAKAQDTNNYKLAELFYFDPNTGIEYGSLVNRQPPPQQQQQKQQKQQNLEDPILAENPFFNPIIAIPEANKLMRQALSEQLSIDRPNSYNTGLTVKRSAHLENAPAAVKRERIIMDALGGDYLIRKRTIY